MARIDFDGQDIWEQARRRQALEDRLNGYDITSRETEERFQMVDQGMESLRAELQGVVQQLRALQSSDTQEKAEDIVKSVESQTAGVEAEESHPSTEILGDKGVIDSEESDPFDNREEN